MNSPGLEPKCPSCGSLEFWPSRRETLEAWLGVLLPYTPLRCRVCLKRYNHPRSWAPKARLAAVCGGGVLALLLVWWAASVMLGDALPPEKTPSRPQAAAGQPAPARAGSPPAASPAQSAVPSAVREPSRIPAPSRSGNGEGPLTFTIRLDIPPHSGGSS